MSALNQLDPSRQGNSTGTVPSGQAAALLALYPDLDRAYFEQL
jgi:hypothetical protein